MQRFFVSLTLALASTLAAAQTPLPQVDAEVRRVDARANKITLKHGEIKNLDMPPMTMVFQVQDPTLLGTVKPGDQVRFTADKVNGSYTVLSLEPAGAASAPAADGAHSGHKH